MDPPVRYHIVSLIAGLFTVSYISLCLCVFVLLNIYTVFFSFVLSADDLRHSISGSDFNLSGLKSGNWYQNITVDGAPGDFARRLVSRKAAGGALRRDLTCQI